MTNTEHVDEKYYQAVQPHSLSERLAIHARDRIYEDFIRLCRPSEDSIILDVGVSDVLNDAANMLERKYPHRRNISAVGLGRASAFQAAYPDVAYTQIEANKPLPFADGAFEIATSNAVLEHVGSGANQAFFVSELCRVAAKVFISVPHRYFPVEHHTGLPILHFWRPSFVLACKWLGKTEWTEDANLILMSRSNLAALVPDGIRAEIGRTGLNLGAFSSNLYLFIDRVPLASRGGRTRP